MFPDPNMPDFDSMSQDELIAWLETLAKRQRDQATDSDADIDEGESLALPEAVQEEWSEWIQDEEALQQETPPASEKSLQPEQELDEEDDDETPTALTTIGDSGSDDTTDPLTWLGDVATEGRSGDRAADAERAQWEEDRDFLSDPESAAEPEDPLDWLESLASEVSEAAAEISQDDLAAAVAQDGDDAYADEETVEDGEDESLYSQRAGESLAFPEALRGLDEPVDDAFSTQSMAPLPDFLVPAPERDGEPPVAGASRDGGAAPAPGHFDSLTHGFLMQDQQAELEAWYAERLRAVAAAGDSASQPAGAPAANPEALETPPPGLRAGFMTARGKIADGQVDAALADYETLLRANIGLDLVVGDLQWLIEQAGQRDNPAVHRVLGDAYMRQGHLQQALDVYRHALTLL